MYIYALIIDAMVTIFPASLNDIQLHILNDLRNLLVFIILSSLYVSFKQHETKVPKAM